jgi:4-hydroxy-2-oxoheptanedioate aldolase
VSVHNGARERPLAQRLRAGETLAGLIIKMPGAATIEMAGHSGFDLVVIDTEHGAGDVLDLEHHLRAADSVGIPALVRVGSRAPIEILRVLDAGATGIIVPRVTDAATVRKVVSAAHYPPVGRRGLATSTRAGRHGMTSVADHVRDAADSTVVIVQLEDAEAVPKVEAIAATRHLDAVFVGPTDLSSSLGHPGDLAHPEVAEAIDHVAEAVVTAEDTALCVLVGDEIEAERWRQRGAGVLLFSAASLFSNRLCALVDTLSDAPATLTMELPLSEVEH